MNAADMDTRPNFPLMKQSNIVNFYHLQMPRWLFACEKYKPLSLESKVAYTFLLNRFQLSRLNGWVNKCGEVFVIFTRENLAEEMQITYKKAIACFKELVAADLIWEKRVGRGTANQIYLAVVELLDKDVEKHTAAPFGNGGARPAETAHQELPPQEEPNQSNSADTPAQEVPEAPFKACQNSTSRPAETEYPDLPKLHPSKKDISYIDLSDTEKVSPSVSAAAREAPTDGRDNSAQEEKTLAELLDRCELWGIDGMVVQDAYSKLRTNTGQRVKNSTAYVMATLFNCIHEGQSDLLVDPYLNSLNAVSPPNCREGATLCY